MSFPADAAGEEMVPATEELTGSLAAMLFQQIEMNDPEAGGQEDSDTEQLEAAEACDEPSGGDRDLWFYRDRTVGLLRRYAQVSVEVGRLPSVLGRELFRARVTSYRMKTFEDAVIFVHDVEQALDSLDEFGRRLVAHVCLQDCTRDEVAALTGCGRRTIGRRFREALDELSKIFLEGGLLTRLPEPEPTRPESCQEGESDESELSDCE